MGLDAQRCSGFFLGHAQVHEDDLQFQIARHPYGFRGILGHFHSPYARVRLKQPSNCLARDLRVICQGIEMGVADVFRSCLANITSSIRPVYASLHATNSMALILLALLAQDHSPCFRLCCIYRLIYINHCSFPASALWYQFLFVEIYSRNS